MTACAVIVLLYLLCFLVVRLVSGCCDFAIGFPFVRYISPSQVVVTLSHTRGMGGLACSHVGEFMQIPSRPGLAMGSGDVDVGLSGARGALRLGKGAWSTRGL